ncbi:unnamed protein product [Blepharisma stoltei]|uniref:BCCIP-like protein n=1 Tax=Blepharisma stoltei TaxID=1481888 RepID=A0AAU9JXD8_9CILI|nr:unnamed protein product [Blepharisma stoltei]
MEEENISFEPSSDAMMMDVNFDFLDPRPEFSLCIRNFLYSLFDYRCPISQLADLICNQEIGTFLVADNGEKPEDNILGFITIVNLSAPSDISSYLMNYLSSKGDISITNNHRVGFLICERIVNLPIELIPVLHNQLVEDVNWAIEKFPQAYAQYDFIISLSKCVNLMNNSGKGRKKRRLAAPESQLYFRLEDEILLKYSEESFTFDAEAGAGVPKRDAMPTTDDSVSNKLVMVLRWENYLNALQEISKTYTNNTMNLE